MEKETWDGDDAWEIALAFDGLIAARAWDMVKLNWKRGVEFDDLFQEGRIAVFRMVPRCEDRQAIVGYVSSSIDWRLKGAAAKVRRRYGTVSLDSAGEEAPRKVSPEEEAKRGGEQYWLDRMELASCDRDYERQRMELAEAIRSRLTAKELTALRGWLAGRKGRETAAEMGISQPAAAKLLGKARAKVARLLEEMKAEREGE